MALVQWKNVLFLQVIFILQKEALKYFKAIIYKNSKCLNANCSNFLVSESLFLPVSLMRILKAKELYTPYRIYYANYLKNI